MKMRWRRPYPGGVWRRATGFFVVVGVTVAALTSGMMVGLVPIPAPGQDANIVGVWVFTVAWLAVAWRLYSAGVYVSPTGIRIKNFHKTTTLRWPAVKRITVGPATVMGVDIDAQAIWIATIDGRDVPTLLIDQSPLFLGRRRAFQEAFDSLGRAHADSASPNSA
jgi:hypothetical protein